MRFSGKKAPAMPRFIGVICLLIFASICRAGDPYSAYYHWSGNRLFWFLIISDIHIGANGSQDTDYLSWAVTEARDVIAPSFIVAAGDLTDSTNGGTIPVGGPYEEEWEAYRQILDAAGIDASSYYDIPGNHDHYDDQNFVYYRAYSIQGSAEGTTQHSWIRQFPFGTYHFVGICTAGNDGASFNIWPWDDYGDHAGLDAGELAFIESELISHPQAELTVLFGHHPFDAGYSDWMDTGLTYGRNALLSLIDNYGISMYAFGHTHDYRENFYYNNLFDGVFYMNVASLGKSDYDHFAVAAIDGNGLSIVPGEKGIWPVVLITAPVDRCLGDCPQPFAYELPQGRANPIRALVFDKNPVTRVQFRLDADATWQPMQPVGQGPLWVGFWDSTGSSSGAHSIEVQAQGSATAVDGVDVFIDPARCMGDSDGDGDMDGSDLAAYAGDFLPEVLPDMASFFGRNNCP